MWPVCGVEIRQHGRATGCLKRSNAHAKLVLCQSAPKKETPGMKLRILSLSADQELTLLRKCVLEAAGHEVVASLSDKEALDAASGKNRFDIAIVCHRMWTGKTRQIMRIFRKNNPDGRFLIVVRVYGEVPDLEGDRYVVGADGPDVLLNVVNEMRNASAQAASPL
jgi:CheY-like chemotaxis protein